MSEVIPKHIMSQAMTLTGAMLRNYEQADYSTEVHIAARALMAAAKEADEAATKRAVEWRPIGTAPRDATVLVAVEATAKNMTFFGRPSQSHPAYIDDSGRVCDAGTWKPDAGLNGEFWRASHWMPLPDPPAILKGEA